MSELLEDTLLDLAETTHQDEGTGGWYYMLPVDELSKFIRDYTAQAVKDAQLELLGRLEETSKDYRIPGWPTQNCVPMRVITAERERLSDNKESE